MSRYLRLVARPSREHSVLPDTTACCRMSSARRLVVPPTHGTFAPRRPSIPFARTYERHVTRPAANQQPASSVN